ITNKDCLSNLFNQFSFTLVVHAAAHKQVSLLERFPDRAFEVNTAASIRLLEFAKQQDSHFLFISSDKSVEPSGILGISKWLVEAFIIQTQSAKTSIFRLPNIKGSRGSFFSEWEKVLHQKGFIPITDEQSTRF